jgi:hypothetical protein
MEAIDKRTREAQGTGRRRRRRRRRRREKKREESSLGLTVKTTSFSSGFAHGALLLGHADSADFQHFAHTDHHHSLDRGYTLSRHKAQSKDERSMVNKASKLLDIKQKPAEKDDLLIHL